MDLSKSYFSYVPPLVHLYDKLVVGDDHLPRAKCPVVDGFGWCLGQTLEALLWPPLGSDQLDGSWYLGLDWNKRRQCKLASSLASVYSWHWAGLSSPRQEGLRWWRYTCRLPSHSGSPCAAGSPPPPPSQLQWHLQVTSNNVRNETFPFPLPRSINEIQCQSHIWTCCRPVWRWWGLQSASSKSRPACRY